MRKKYIFCHVESRSFDIEARKATLLSLDISLVILSNLHLIHGIEEQRTGSICLKKRYSFLSLVYNMLTIKVYIPHKYPHCDFLFLSYSETYNFIALSFHENLLVTHQRHDYKSKSLSVLN
jgi:hypothetical protein